MWFYMSDVWCDERHDISLVAGVQLVLQSHSARPPLSLQCPADEIPTLHQPPHLSAQGLQWTHQWGLTVHVSFLTTLSLTLSFFVKLIFPDTTVTADQKFRKMRIMSLHKQLDYSKGLFMYRALNSEAPKYISNLYTCPPSHYSNSRHYQLSLPRPRRDIFKTS